MGKKRSWTDSDLEHAIAASDTWTDTLRVLGLSIHSGGPRSHVRRVAEENDLDFSHFVQHKAAGRASTMSASEILVDYSNDKRKSVPQGPRLRLALIEIGRKDECETADCQVETDWLSKPITLQVDHIDGNRKDCRPCNLRLLCPNCHTQTETWGYRGKDTGPAPKKDLCSCGSVKGIKSKRCVQCHIKTKKQKIDWPPTEEVVERLRRSSFSALARELQVSDNAIRSFLRRNGVAKPWEVGELADPSGSEPEA